MKQTNLQKATKDALHKEYNTLFVWNETESCLCSKRKSTIRLNWRNLSPSTWAQLDSYSYIKNFMKDVSVGPLSANYYSSLQVHEECLLKYGLCFHNSILCTITLHRGPKYHSTWTNLPNAVFIESCL